MGTLGHKEGKQMARNKKILVPEAREGLDQLKGRIMKAKGYDVNMTEPDNVKYEIAKEQGIPLEKWIQRATHLKTSRENRWTDWW